MKPVVFAIAALALGTSFAHASSSGPIGSGDRAVSETVAVEVPASSVMTNRELVQAGLDGDDLVTVTKILAPEGQVDNSSRGF